MSFLFEKESDLLKLFLTLLNDGILVGMIKYQYSLLGERICVVVVCVAMITPIVMRAPQ